MSSHHNEIAEAAGINIYWRFLFSLIVMIATYIIPTSDFQFPVWLMQLGQLIAWSCIAGTFIIAVLKHFGIKWNPFKKKK